MRAPLSRIAAAAALSALVSTPAVGYVSLCSSTGNVIHWPSGSLPVPYVINIAGSDNIPGDASEDLAIRLGFQAWEAVPGSSIAFAENTDPAQRARTDWAADDIHLMFFDETGASGFFPPGSGIIAITPVQFFTNGNIADGDILFNGLDEMFSTDLAPGTFDVWSIAAHEIGHFIGLDHTGDGGATMAPFADEQEFNQRTLGDDDVAAAENVYPATMKGGLQGLVLRSASMAPVQGAHVWARRSGDGRVATTTLTDAAGAYDLTGLDPGTYVVTAEPLDGPISDANIISFCFPTIESDFEPASSGAETVVGTAVTVVPDLLVDADVALNIELPAVPISIHQGETLAMVTIVGAGLAGAVVDVPDAPGGTFTIVGTAPTFSLMADASALLGVYDLQVTNGLGDVAYLNGFLEVLPPAPGASSSDPGCSDLGGGTMVKVTGTDLDGAFAVLFGDGQGTNVVVNNSTSVSATTPAHAPATVDVVVVTGGGEEARLPSALLYGDALVAGSIFPAAGSTAGGTAATILGSGFDPAATVEIGGVPVATRTFVDPTRIDVVTAPLAAGSHDVVVTNPGGGTCDTTTLPAGFDAVAAADPTFGSVDPAVVPHLGGATVSVLGTDWVDGAIVAFGADLTTGAGGTPGVTTFVSPTELSVVVPPGMPGSTSVLVVNPSGQAAGMAGALTYAPLLQGKDKIAGTIGAAGEVDSAFFDGIAGTLLSIKLSASSGSTLEPKVVIKDAGGTELLSSDPADPTFDPLFAFPAGSKVSVKKFVLPGTETYAFEISGMNSTTGAYAFSAKEKIPSTAKKVKLPKEPPLVAGPGTADIDLVAKRNSTLKGKIKALDGLDAFVSDLVGPAGSILGKPAVSMGITTEPDGSQIKFTNVPLADFGDYVLSIGANGATTGPISGSLSVKGPKSKVTLNQ